MTQMKGGLNSHSCAGLPLPRDFGHFASPSWLNNENKSTMYKIKKWPKREKKKTSRKLECPGISSMYE